MDETSSLIKQAQKGRQEAFAGLMHMYQHQVYGLSYSLTGNHQDAQDLAQEVFLKAYRSLHGFRGEADFGTWLHRITVNLWINQQRRRKNQVVVSLDAPVPTQEGEVTREVAVTDADPQELFTVKELQAVVRQALDSLSREHRAVLVLREMQGHTYEEIAQILNCTLGTVKSRLNRARQVFKEKATNLMREAGMDFPD